MSPAVLVSVIAAGAALVALGVRKVATWWLDRQAVWRMPAAKKPEDPQWLVRLKCPLEGHFCTFSAGEVVALSGEPGMWRVEKRVWRGSNPVYNVLTHIPNNVLQFEDVC